VGLCGAESACNDGVDNDGDLQTDCGDPDCFENAACKPATFTFLDTVGNDIAPNALLSFFSSFTPTPTDYIYFSVGGPAFADFAWCSERADFYRDAYLLMAVDSGYAYSGPWNRWSLSEGGSWTGPDAGVYENRYALDCVESHAWCAESGLGGREPVILPGQTNQCEAGDLTLGCGDGAVVFVLKVGPRRLSTCGF
jgi:hypothetical protein